MTDRDYMMRALRLAEQGRGRTSPNPMVGAVVVSNDGVVVGSGYHAGAGEPHAEVRALAAAGSRARGATLYTTLEPCCHTGRTGPCVEPIVAAGITRIVVAVEDPNPAVCGRGVRALRDSGMAVALGVARHEASRLNDVFFTFMNRRRPHVTMKIAVSLDGRIAAAPGRQTPLTGRRALGRVHALRAEVDAIGVGSGTILVDDPLLTARGIYRARPVTRVIFDSRLRVQPAARVLSTLDAGPVIIVTTEAGVSQALDRRRALVEAGAILEVMPRRDLRAALTRLAEIGISSVLLEGGASLHAAAWQAGVVDRVQIFVAPVTLGPEGVPWMAGLPLSLGQLHDRSVRQCGDDILIDGYVHGAG